MPDLDDLLQQKLNDLENGMSLESVIRDLPEEAAELIQLLQLTAAMRSLPTPQPNLAAAHAGQRRVMDAAREVTTPVRRPAAPITQPQRPAARPSWLRGNRRIHPAFTALGALVLLAVLAAGGLLFWLTPPAGAQAATVMDISGQVEAASSAQAEDWQPLENGDTVTSGQRLRTLGASGATLVFYEGSRTIVESNSDLTLTQVEGARGKVLRVLIDQSRGKTANSVVPFRSSQSSFVVNTPSGSATVHGTRFNVEIGAQGKARFSVERGKVLVYNDLSQVFVAAGQVAQSAASETIPAPSYQFSLQGSLEAVDGSLWTAAGVAFNVNEETVLNGEFAIGAPVRVTGRILADGTRAADRVDPAGSGETLRSFSGAIQSLDGTSWIIGGYTLLVDAATEKPGDLAAGQVVQVVFEVLADGSWHALKIESLTETPDEPTPVPSPTADPNAKPSLAFLSDEVEIAGCGDEFSSSAALTNTAGEAKDAAANVKLGYLISRGGEYVTGVQIEPDGWPVIAAGESVNLQLRVQVKPEYRQAKGSDKQIKLRIFLASETNRPDHLQSRMTVTIISSCKDETEQPSQQPSGTLTLTPEVSPTAVATGAASCTGANPQPEGMRLAERYNVPYEEIMGWFCQHFGFGEIDTAYELSLQSGKPVSEIFAMRRSGMGWGEIKKLLQPAGKGKPTDSPGKPNPKPETKPTKKK